MLRLIWSGSGYLLHCRSISFLPVVALVRSNFRCPDCGGADAYRSRRRTFLIHSPAISAEAGALRKLLPQAKRINVRHCTRTGEWDADTSCLIHARPSQARSGHDLGVLGYRLSSLLCSN